MMTMELFEELSDPSRYISGATINFCLSVIIEGHERVYAAESTEVEKHFDKFKFKGAQYPVCRSFTQANPLLNYDRVLIPINLSRKHWSLCIVDRKCNTIYLFDSLPGEDTDQDYSILEEMKKFLNYWGNDRIRYKVEIGKCPRQEGNNCGPHVIMNAKASLSLEANLMSLNYDTKNIRTQVQEIIESTGKWNEIEQATDEDVMFIQDASSSIEFKSPPSRFGIRLPSPHHSPPLRDFLSKEVEKLDVIDKTNQDESSSDSSDLSDIKAKAPAVAGNKV
jgi:hypothetical protein